MDSGSQDPTSDLTQALEQLLMAVPAFDEINQEGKTIDQEEWRDAVIKYCTGFKPSEEVIRSIFDRIDVHNEGAITHTEFFAAIGPLLDPNLGYKEALRQAIPNLFKETCIMEAFKRMDVARNGKIDRQEFEQGIKQLNWGKDANGKSYTDKLWVTNVFDTIDTANAGEISPRELFVALGRLLQLEAALNVEEKERKLAFEQALRGLFMSVDKIAKDFFNGIITLDDQAGFGGYGGYGGSDSDFQVNFTEFHAAVEMKLHGFLSDEEQTKESAELREKLITYTWTVIRYSSFTITEHASKKKRESAAAFEKRLEEKAARRGDTDYINAQQLLSTVGQVVDRSATEEQMRVYGVHEMTHFIQCMEIFMRMDKTTNYLITNEEFTTFVTEDLEKHLKPMGMDGITEELADIFDKLDTHQTGSLTGQEFFAVFGKQLNEIHPPPKIDKPEAEVKMDG